MKVSPDDYKAIMEHLVKQRDEGNQFIAYPGEQDVIRKDDLVSLFDAYEAMEYCNEKSTVMDTYSYLPIKTVCMAMSDALQGRSCLIERSGLIDIEAMVDQYWKGY